MAWNPNIPNPTDLISASQAQIKANFQALDPLFTSAQYVLLPQQAQAPTTSSSQIGLYAQTSPITSALELYIVRASNGAQISATAAGLSSSGWSYLPSGLLMKWGNDSTTTYNDLETKSFPTASNIPVFNNIYSMQLTPASGATDPNQVMILGALTTTTYQVFARQLVGFGGATPYTYFAIGD